MVKGTDIKIRRFINAVKQENYPLESVYLFGSFAKGNDGADSDIDLALIFSNLDDSKKFDVQVELMLLASNFDARIEPHPLSKEEFYSESPFAAQIRRTGIIIKDEALETK